MLYILPQNFPISFSIALRTLILTAYMLTVPQNGVFLL